MRLGAGTISTRTIRGDWFVGLSAVDPLIGFAGGTDTALQSLDKPVAEAFLPGPGPAADRARQALGRQLAVDIGYLSVGHTSMIPSICRHAARTARHPFPGLITGIRRPDGVRHDAGAL